MNTKTVKTTIYVAEDGSEFLTQSECENYEKNTLERLKKIKYFILWHSADFTEGRGYQSYSLIASECNYNQTELARMYAQMKHGLEVQWMYSSPTYAWSLKEISKEEYFNTKVHQFGKRIFLSHSDILNFPKAIHLTSKTDIKTL